MEADTKRQRWTYSEFARLPTSGSTRYEVIDGELVVTPSPSLRHQRIVTDLVTVLNTFTRANDLGDVFVSPLDVLFAEGDYLEPDILYVRKGRGDLLSDRGVEGPPDLVVEVLSPSTVARDRGVKLERYRHYGVPEYWVVDSDECTMEVWDLAHGASEPAAYGPTDTYRWMPQEGGASLDIDLAELFGTE
jgi:Uma2 family endonuclease